MKNPGPTLHPDWTTFRGQLRSFVYKRVRDIHATEDIVQDVFLKVQSRISQLQHAEKVIGWVYQIARNTITDHFRRNQKHVQPDDIDWDSSWKALNECVTHCVSQTMMQLPHAYREALELTELQNLSQTELAQRLRISYSGAKSRVQRARAMLKEMMETQYQIEMDKYGNVLVCKNLVPCNCGSQFDEACA